MIHKEEIEWICDDQNKNSSENDNTGEKHKFSIQISDAQKCMIISRNTCNIIAGSTNSGKTNLLLNILRLNYKLWNSIYFVCPTLDLQSQYKDIVIQKNILTNERDIERLFTEQTNNQRRYICIVLDDCISTISFQSSNIFDKLASSCRHYRITCFILIQDLKKLSPTIRDNCSNLFITKLKEHSLRCCFDLSSDFPNYKSFKDFMDSACKDYRVVKMNLAAGYDTNTIFVFTPNLLNRKIKFR